MLILFVSKLAYSVLLHSQEFTEHVEFQREMNALLHIRAHGGHPNICMLRENFDEEDDYLLVLDLVMGKEMFDHLIEHGAYSEADASRLVRQVASALDFIHGIGVVHADLKVCYYSTSFWKDNVLLVCERISYAHSSRITQIIPSFLYTNASQSRKILCLDLQEGMHSSNSLILDAPRYCLTRTKKVLDCDCHRDIYLTRRARQLLIAPRKLLVQNLFRCIRPRICGLLEVSKLSPTWFIIISSILTCLRFISNFSHCLHDAFGTTSF